MGRVLVVFGTKTGCTEGIAHQVGDTLTAAGHEVDVAPVTAAPAAAGYDAVIVGSGVRAGSWHASAKSWVVANAAALREQPLAIFTACLTMASNPEKADEVRAYTDPLVAEAGLEPVDVGLFAGMNVSKTFSFPERLIMKAMKAPQGDFRDLDAVAAWTREVAPKLGLG